MNRGRRRGGVSSGFSNLRDGVKRRLFDPFAVPVSPDPQTIISRLAPLKIVQPTIPSSLTNADADQPPKRDDPTHEQLFQLKLFEKMAVVDYAFQNCPSRQSMPARSEGIYVGKAMTKYPQSTTAHLLMIADEVNFWKDGTILSSFSNPLDWYPSEIADRLKVRLTAKPRSTKRPRFDDDNGDDLPDQAILEIPDPNDALNDGDGREDADRGGSGGQEDAEDARWNGDQVGGPGGGDDDDDEVLADEDNDYCETYFDNGEGDIDDFNVQMHDGGGGEGEGSPGGYYE